MSSPHDAQDDQTLIHSALTGDEDAFAALIERHYDMIYTVAYKWSGSRADAEDITQDVCIKLAASLPKFDGRSRFTTWLYRMILNTSHDVHRRHNTRSRHMDAFGMDALDQDGPETPEQALRATRLYKTIHQLPDKLRDAILLVCAEGLSHKEAGRILECAEATISWRVHQARKKLSIILEDEVRHG